MDKIFLIIIILAITVFGSLLTCRILNKYEDTALWLIPYFGTIIVNITIIEIWLRYFCCQV